MASDDASDDASDTASDDASGPRGEGGGRRLLRVSVVYSPCAGEVEEVELELPDGATVADALAASGLAGRHPGLERLPVGIWGSFRERDARLRDRDRVELYRPLQVDPMEARRLRERARLAARGRRG